MTSTARSTSRTGPRKIRLNGEFESIASDPLGSGPFPPDQPHVPPTAGGTAMPAPHWRPPPAAHNEYLTVHRYCAVPPTDLLPQATLPSALLFPLLFPQVRGAAPAPGGCSPV